MKIHGLDLYDFLKGRGLIYQTTDEKKLKEILNGKPITFYLGIDPTADAIHMGHLCSHIQIFARSRTSWNFGYWWCNRNDW